MNTIKKALAWIALVLGAAAVYVALIGYVGF